MSYGEDSPIDGIPNYDIELPDGIFRCVPCYFGGNSVEYRGHDRLRWIVYTPDGRNLIGPAIEHDGDPETVRRAIAAWWPTERRDDALRPKR